MIYLIYLSEVCKFSRNGMSFFFGAGRKYKDSLVFTLRFKRYLYFRAEWYSIIADGRGIGDWNGEERVREA